MMSLPNPANSRWLPERKPSPTPTSGSKDPTPQAIPNLVKIERSFVRPEVAKDLCEDVKRRAHHRETFSTLAASYRNQAWRHLR
jgi:hypothetical protein